MYNAVENTTLVRAVQEDVKDASKWIALAESQSTIAARTQILSRAVETVPSSQELWERLVDAKVQSGKHGLFEVLSDALGLFPSSVSLWQRMLALFPSVETYTAALRHLDNQLVWPAYLEFLHANVGVSPAQRYDGYKHFLEYAPGDEATLRDLALRLASVDQADDAAKLLLSRSCSNWQTWELLVNHEASSCGLLESAAHAFPNKDSIIVPLLAQKWAMAGENNKARAVLMHAVSSPSSVSAFCAIFRVACEYYESTIDTTLKERGAGATEVARVLTEFGNLIRKRPMYLSDVAVREFPNNVELWKSRAALWKHRPHIAADVLETAIKTIDPARAYHGELSDLWVEYTRLLITNGSDLSLARGMLVKALDTHFAKVSEKVKLYIALAELEQDGAQDAAAAVRVLESAIRIPALTTSHKLWSVYMSTLVETKSPRLLEAFSDCCMRQMVSMRIVLMVAQAFADASDNQVIVYEKGVQLFPFPLVLPLWKHYLAAVQKSFGISELRALYDKALKGAAAHRRATEELKIMYSRAERCHPSGSRIFAKRVLGSSVHDSKNAELWHEYIELHDDPAQKRRLYEESIQKLDDREACNMALSMAKFETHLEEFDRARALYRYAVGLSEALQDERDALLAEWQAFEDAHGDERTQQEMASALNPSLKIHFVPSVEMET